jgi:hypothetical protein
VYVQAALPPHDVRTGNAAAAAEQVSRPLPALVPLRALVADAPSKRRQGFSWSHNLKPNC